MAYVSFKKGTNQALFIMLVLIATLLTEISAMTFSKYRIQGFDFIVHIFNLIEYVLFSMYYLEACRNSKLKIGVKLSIPLFIASGLWTSIFVYHFKGLPVWNIDVEGFLLFVIYSHLLFCLDDDKNRAIYTHPDFWISIGVLIFFGGAFVVFGLYPILLHLDPIKALNEYGFILKPLNMIFYNCIIIGLICLIRNKRYLTR